jgi:predicted nucleotide-binding protein
MLLEFGLSPLVLHEEASGGLTLAEKLEKYSKDVGYAFVILTPEDVGGHRDEMRQKLGGDTPFLSRSVTLLGGKVTDQVLELFEPRARQNVIFEMGYFWGLLERKRVCCLLKGNVEKPSDIEGIVFVPFKDSIEEIQVKIMRELKEAGYEIKL